MVSHCSFNLQSYECSLTSFHVFNVHFYHIWILVVIRKPLPYKVLQKAFSSG